MPRALAEIMTGLEIGVDELMRRSGLDSRTVQAIVRGQYTPSPAQRDRIAEALGVPRDEISWGHTIPVQHLRGNGPQFGRST